MPNESIGLVIVPPILALEKWKIVTNKIKCYVSQNARLQVDIKKHVITYEPSTITELFMRKPLTFDF